MYKFLTVWVLLAHLTKITATTTTSTTTTPVPALKKIHESMFRITFSTESPFSTATGFSNPTCSLFHYCYAIDESFCSKALKAFNLITPGDLGIDEWNNLNTNDMLITKQVKKPTFLTDTGCMEQLHGKTITAIHCFIVKIENKSFILPLLLLLPIIPNMYFVIGGERKNAIQVD
uniref:Uncharacterized protein n=1 Tax=Glossina palpalis gambiensis TaxID=67801 RepID=A0A1B0BL91_9MUSC